MEIFVFILLIIGGICGIIYTCIHAAEARIKMARWLYGIQRTEKKSFKKNEEDNENEKK